ncbi:MAG: hypothetical protein M1832_001950 [Thelocarpon impressellum]|nr:MAG: hypothetical protein M1832_001950 [Thelocarpon impressellum]
MATESSADSGRAGRRAEISSAQHLKIAKGLEACDNGDFDALAVLACGEHGLVSDEVRSRAWPFLLGCGNATVLEDPAEKLPDWRSLPEHRDEHQVKLDVDRSFIYYPRGQSTKELDRRKVELSDLITEVLRRYPFLCYFQGYHDICQVLLLVLGKDESVAPVARLSILRIRDFMLPSLAPALSHLRLLPSILYAVDAKLCDHLSQTQPFFALAATLTLYAHDIQEYGDIARLFDVLLAREATFSVYLFAQVVLQRKEELLEIPPDEPEMLHSVLCKLPKPLNLEGLISKTIALIKDHPPESLKSWRQISPRSVLKTARYPAEAAAATLGDGEVLFRKQNEQLRRDELRQRALRQLWVYRRPAGSVALAVLVGVISWWMRKNGGPGGLFGLDSFIYPLYKRLQVFWP